MFCSTNWCLVAQIGFGVGYRLEIGVSVAVAIDFGRRFFSVSWLVF